MTLLIIVVLILLLAYELGNRSRRRHGVYIDGFTWGEMTARRTAEPTPGPTGVTAAATPVAGTVAAEENRAQAASLTVG